MSSKLHNRTKELLEELYPNCPIREELPINIRGRNLRIDLYVDFPFHIAVECQGEQHDKFVPFFHRTEYDFRDSLRRDRLKDIWAYEKAIPLVYVYHHEYDDLDINKLRDKIELAEKEIDKDFGLR